MALLSISCCPRLALEWFWLAERGVGSSPIDSPDVAAGWSPRRPARWWRPGWPALVNAHYSDTAVIISPPLSRPREKCVCGTDKAP